MLTIKKRGQTLQVLSVIILSVTFLTACGPPGPRALQKGERLVAAGKYPEAIVQLEQATQLLTNAPDADQAQAWNWLGVARHYSGLYAPASKAYQTARGLDRNLAAAAYNWGCLLVELKYYREGIDQLLTCVQLPHPAEISDRDVYLKVASGYLQQGMQATGAERNRNFDAAGRFLVEVQKKEPSAEALNGLGMFYVLRHRSPNEAVVRFKEALRLQPNYPPAMLNLAIVHHYYLNDRRLALQEYKAYLALQPPPANAKEVEGVAQQLERELASTPTAQAVPAEAPTNKATSSVAGELPKLENFNTEKTNNAAKSVLASTPPSTNLNGSSLSPGNEISTSRAAVGGAASPSPASPLKAPSVPTLATSSQPKPTPGNREEAARWLSKGLQAQRATNWVEALSAYRNAAKADPSSFEAVYRLGAAAQENGNLAAALEAFERAVSLKPDSVEARYAYGWALHKGKFPQDSIRELEALLKQAPGDTRAHLLIANIYARDLGQPAQAREHYTKVLELEPRHAQAIAIRAWLATGSL